MAQPIPYAAADYLDTLLKALPRGRAWTKDADGNLATALAPLMPMLAALDARACNLVTDGFPGTTVELLPEWESSLGLPDPCQGEAPTIQARQGQVVARLIAGGSLSIPFYTAYAAALGHDVTIMEFAPFFADLSCAGAALAGIEAAYLWQVTPSSTLSPTDLAVLQCELTRIAPPYTQFFVVNV